LSGSRGDLGQLYAVAALIGIAGFAMTAGTYSSLRPAFFIGTPIAQIIAATVIERR
jgi:hypothetical protein